MTLQAAEQLLPLVYDELRKLAAEKMANERPGQTLEATVPCARGVPAADSMRAPSALEQPGHFFAAAADAMRRILIEWLRRGVRETGQWRRVDFEGARPNHLGHARSTDRAVRCARAAHALDQLAGELVKLRYLAGLSLDEAAAAVVLRVEGNGLSPLGIRSRWLRSELLKDE